MIRVERGAEPEGFISRADEWQRQFVETTGRNPSVTASQYWSRIRHKLRGDARVLYKNFYGKCAYCEAKMSHVSNPHIEHYRPKSKPEFAHLIFSWENWLLSCGRCNDKKWSHFPDCAAQPCLIDPCSEEPSEHLDFIRAQIISKTERGEETIKLVGLARTPLVEERARWLNTIDMLLLLIIAIPAIRIEVRELLIWAMQSDAPYAAMTRSYLRKKTPLLAEPPIPHPHIEPLNQIERIADLVEMYKSEIEKLI